MAERGQFQRDHERDMADPEYAEAYRQATDEVTTSVPSTERRSSPGSAAPQSSSPASIPYRAILADPPWTYTFATRSSEITGTGWHGDVGNHYPTMTLDAIKALPVAEWAGDDSMLWLWAVNPLLREALDVMAAWGFTYKTALTWAKLGKNGKPAFGMGYWLRGATEHVLIGTRGRVKPQVRNVVSWFTAERQAHSRKPDYVHDLIERYTPGPYLEMFARRQRPAWDSWGDEIGDAA